MEKASKFWSFWGRAWISPIFLNLPFRCNMSHSAFRKAVCMVHNCSKEPKSSRVVPALKHTAGTKAEAESSFQCRLRFAGSSVYLHQLPFEYMYYSTTLYNTTTTYKKHFKKMLGELLLSSSEFFFSVQWLTLTFTNVSCWQISHLVVSLKILCTI